MREKFNLGPFRSILVFCVIALVILMASRLGLGLWQADRVTDAGGWSDLFFQGLRVDVATLCWLWGVAALGTAIFSGPHLVGRLWHVILRSWLTVGLWLIVFLEASTPAFIEEYGIRPNRLYVEYLIYPKEVLSMLWAGRPIEVIFSLLLTIITLWFGWRLSGSLLKKPT